MAFANDVVGGSTLLRPAIRSPNYVPGKSGWTINRDGSAEFSTGTFRGPVVVIDPNTGLILGSIGGNGVGAFTNVSTNDVQFGPLGQSLIQFFNGAPQGIKGFFGTTGALPLAGNGVFNDIMWTTFKLDTSRLYYLVTQPFTAHNNAAGVSRLTVRLHLTSTLGFSGNIGTVTFDIGGGNESVINVGQLFADPTGGTFTITLQAQGSAGTFTFPNAAGINLFALDYGSLTLVPPTGGTGSPAGPVARSTIYPMTASQAYDGHGNPSVQAGGTTDVSFSSFNDGLPGGTRDSVLLFNGAQMRSDLAGATAISGRMFFYCLNSVESNGSLEYSLGNGTTIPATFNPFAGTGNFFYNQIWPIPGWNSVSLLDSGSGHVSITDIIAGANQVQLISTFLQTHGTLFAGVGRGGSTIPYIQLFYTK